MAKKILTHSFTNPRFQCYKTIEAEKMTNNPENAPTFRLFSTKCKSGECFVTECSTKEFTLK
jgi:hypothetical protein